MNPPDPAWMQWLDRLGIPVAIMVVAGVAVRSLWKWAQPHLDAMITAWVKRQNDMAEATKRLVDKTIEIQEATARGVEKTSQVVADMGKTLPQLCQWKKRTR